MAVPWKDVVGQRESLWTPVYVLPYALGIIKDGKHIKEAVVSHREAIASPVAVLIILCI